MGKKLTLSSFFFLCLMLLVLPQIGHSQSPLDAFNPNANDVVLSITAQQDGKILIGGNFTTIGTVAKNCVARLNPDGSLDTAFNPNPNGSVSFHRCAGGR